MRNLLIPLFLLFTSSVYASIRVPQFELAKEDAEELGIVFVNDSYGEVLFGTSIARFNDAYHFQIQSTHLPYSKLTISCDVGPNSFGQSYILDVIEHLN